MMQVQSFYGWSKGTSHNELTVSNEEIKPIALAVFKLCLSKEISKSARQ